MPRVQALGLYLDDLACAQVSMNLLDFSVTPLWRVWEEVGRAATEAGVGLRESELIGLCPLAALADVADHIGSAQHSDARGAHRRTPPNGFGSATSSRRWRSSCGSPRRSVEAEGQRHA